MTDERISGAPWVVEQAKATAAELAMRLGVPVPPLAYVAFAMQIANESANGNPATIAWRARNPFNLTDPGRTRRWYGTIDWIQGGSPTEQHFFPVFANDVDGPKNAAANYLQGPQYKFVLRAFVLGDPFAIAQAIQESPWSSNHYGFSLAPAVQRALDAGIGGQTMDYAAIEDQVKATIRVMVVAEPQLIAGALEAASPEILARVKAALGIVADIDAPAPAVGVLPHSHTGTVTVK